MGPGFVTDGSGSLGHTWSEIHVSDKVVYIRPKLNSITVCMLTWGCQYTKYKAV